MYANKKSDKNIDLLSSFETNESTIFSICYQIVKEKMQLQEVAMINL